MIWTTTLDAKIFFATILGKKIIVVTFELQLYYHPTIWWDLDVIRMILYLLQSGVNSCVFIDDGQVRYPDKSGEMVVHGKIYYLKQMHWHAPSEHRIDGKQYVLS